MSDQHWSLVLCERCSSEGRLISQGRNAWDEIDNGECPDCNGTGRHLVNTEPLTAQDIHCQHCHAEPPADWYLHDDDA